MDRSRYAVAVHDCDSGNWLYMPRHIANAINSMTPNSELAESDPHND